MARAVLSAGVALVCLVSAVPASAHLRSGTVAVDYQASIFRPTSAAMSAQIYQSDHGLALTLKPGHVVVMLGYLGEPVFRLDSAGLWVNAASPTAAAMHLLGRVRVVNAPVPRWRLHRGRDSIVWHDARVQGLPAGLDRGVWTVPLIIDGRRASLRGQLRRFPAPSLWLWLAVLACWLAPAGPLWLMRRRDLARPTAVGFAYVAAGATTLVALAFALDPYASPGTWIEGLDATLFLAVGIGFMLRGAHTVQVAAAVWIGLVSLAVGLLQGAIFLHPIVLAILPSTIMRILVTAAIGAALTAAVVGLMLFAEMTEALRDSSQMVGLVRPDHDVSEHAPRDASSP